MNEWKMYVKNWQSRYSINITTIWCMLLKEEGVPSLSLPQYILGDRLWNCLLHALINISRTRLLINTDIYNIAKCLLP